MAADYFKRVNELTGTKFWINNVTRQEAALAIEAGAMGCTQNPSYTYKMLTHPTEKEYAMNLLQETLDESKDNNEVECLLQGKLVKEVSNIFLPLWQQTYGRHGYVSIQGDPINEEDPAVIIHEGRRNRNLNPNVMIKIPATKAGLEAMEVLIAENTPINATEVMGVGQALSICEMYRKISEKTGKLPVIYYSLITGIYDEYLQKYVLEKNVPISSDIVFMAGMIIAQKVYKITKAHYPEVGFIGGGVRGLQHFTEMIGSDTCITMNWPGQAEELIRLNQPVVPRFFNPVPEKYLEELLEKVPDFKRAYMENGLNISEYEHFGPVEYFREMFVSAWKDTLQIIDHARKEN